MIYGYDISVLLNNLCTSWTLTKGRKFLYRTRNEISSVDVWIKGCSTDEQINTLVTANQCFLEIQFSACICNIESPFDDILFVVVIGSVNLWSGFTVLGS